MNFAVRCENFDIAYRVNDKLKKEGSSGMSRESISIGLGKYHDFCISSHSTYQKQTYFKERGYKVLSSEEYLGESETETVMAKPFIKEEINMNKAVAAVYEKTQDALLVDKHSGIMGVTSYFKDQLILTTYKKEFLAEAKRLEELNENKV